MFIPPRAPHLLEPHIAKFSMDSKLYIGIDRFSHFTSVRGKRIPRTCWFYSELCLGWKTKHELKAQGLMISTLFQKQRPEGYWRIALLHDIPPSYLMRLCGCEERGDNGPIERNAGGGMSRKRRRWWSRRRRKRRNRRHSQSIACAMNSLLVREIGRDLEDVGGKEIFNITGIHSIPSPTSSIDFYVAPNDWFHSKYPPCNCYPWGQRIYS